MRFVALGDSFTEGVGDPAPTLPNGVRGWADRVAEQLALVDPHALYANLAVRGKKLGQVIAEQVEPAIALQPTLVTIYAGGNDILRPSIDIDRLAEEYDKTVARIAATGATVALFTGFDTAKSPVFNKTRGRTAIYNELLREIADNHSALIIDYWRFAEYNDPRMWDVDRLHMSSIGHKRMAVRVLETLRSEHVIQSEELGPLPLVGRRKAFRSNVAWAKEYVGPWIGRRIRGTSSGDSLTARWPELRPVLSTLP
jgi:lysophospholipase L1-like esterase